MKKYILSVALTLSFFLSFQITSAQVQCSVITQDNVDQCCVGVNPPAACADYTNINAGGDTQGGGPVVTQCSQGIDQTNHDECCNGTNADQYAFACSQYETSGGQTGGGGTINTNPTNSDASSSGVITPTPQASSSALFACNAISFDSLLDILIWLKCVIGAAIIPLLFTISFLLFLWGMVRYIRGSDDVKQREENKKFIYWGIIGLTVMVSVWGIVKIVNSTFGFGNTVPELQTDYLKKN